MDTIHHYDSENEHTLDIKALRKQNHDAAQQIFKFISNLLTISPYNKQQQRYIISFAKHVYRWARITSYHEICINASTNDKKISKLMNIFSKEFKQKYLPPLSCTKSQKFYELYPSKQLTNLIFKYTKKPNTNSFISKRKPKTQTLCQSTTVPIVCKPATPISPIPSANKQRILLIMDFDDTLIPTAFIKLKNHNINWDNTTYKERISMDKYITALNEFIDTLLKTFNYNIDRNITILTNASTAWVKEESMFNSGHLFALKMKTFIEKISKYKIDIISALDNWLIACKHYKNGFNSIQPYKWKWKIMNQLFKETFGKKLNGMFDIKVISLGDSYESEYKGAGVAFSKYLSKQNINKTKNIKISLHRIKFIEHPNMDQLARQLIWCNQNIQDIVWNKHKSNNYILKDKI